VDGWGGALKGWGFKAVNCRFLGNSALSGGAASVAYDATFSNCIFSGNTCTKAAVICEIYGVNCYNCVIYGNSPIGLGGAFDIVQNCILWGNGPCNGEISCAEHQLNIFGFPVNCIIEEYEGYPAGHGNLAIDPMLMDPDGADNVIGTEDDDFRLQADSPCIDAGSNRPLFLDEADLNSNGITLEYLPHDFDGNPRFVDDPSVADAGCALSGTAIADIGAFEFSASNGARAPKAGDLNGDFLVNAADLGLLLAAWESCPGPCCAADLTDEYLWVDYQDLELLLDLWEQ
jgi:hypothetical protein